MADEDLDKMADCPVLVSIGVIGGKWKTRILWSLRDGPKRFSQLRREITAVSEKMLSQHLQELEDDEIICRRKFMDGAVLGVEYRYSQYGATLIPALDQLGAWGATHAQRQAGGPG